MAVNSKSSVSGFTEMQTLLRKLPEKIAANQLQNATRAGARELAKEVRRAAPVGDKPSAASKQYGRLKRNIRVSRLRKVKPGERGAMVSTGNAFWGNFLEFGTKHMKARPWFRQAIAASAQAALDKFAQILAKGIEREAQKLAGNQAKGGRK